MSVKLRDVIGQMDGMLDGHDKRCGEVEPDSSPSRKVSRLELNVKKDSGYGSQGLITVDQVPILQLLVNLKIVQITFQGVRSHCLIFAVH